LAYIVGIDGDGEGCGVVEGEDCSNVVEGVVFIGVVEQVAKRDEVGSTTVTTVVMIRGTVSVETAPVHASMSQVSDKTEKHKAKSKIRRLPSTHHLVESAR
jgi:hypothetical protein